MQNVARAWSLRDLPVPRLRWARSLAVSSAAERVHGAQRVPAAKMVAVGQSSGPLFTAHNDLLSKLLTPAHHPTHPHHLQEGEQHGGPTRARGACGGVRKVHFPHSTPWTASGIVRKDPFSRAKTAARIRVHVPRAGAEFSHERTGRSGGHERHAPAHRLRAREQPGPEPGLPARRPQAGRLYQDLHRQDDRLAHGPARLGTPAWSMPGPATRWWSRSSAA